MKIRYIESERFQDYKTPSMFVAFPYCSFKCEKESGVCCCQNSALTRLPIIDIDAKEIVRRYSENPITSALVLGGLEPFDSYDDVYRLIFEFRKRFDDPVIIYTGYYKHELEGRIAHLRAFSNIIIKWGRYDPLNSQKKWDDVLGVCLSSNNQYAERIS